MARRTLQPHAAAGFTLVEALVALLVLSVGLLGIAGLQMTGLRANLSAASRSQATYLAEDILDRMRANTDAARSGAYTVALGATLTGTGTAQQDVQAWNRALAAFNPTAQGQISAINAGLVTITIQWLDSRGGDASLCTGANLDNCSPLSLTTTAQL